MTNQIEVDTRKSPAVRFHTLRHDDRHCVVAVGTDTGRVVGQHVCSVGCAAALYEHAQSLTRVSQ